jgi:GT2 family glycosyltransferase
MDVSICIVNWNVKEILAKCIQAIKQNTKDLDYEIIVVDNASTDDSVKKIGAEYPDVILVASDVNLGFAKGNNLAVEYAKGNYILYLNPDTEIVTNAIAGMHAFIDAHPECGAVGCKLTAPNGDIQYTCASSFPFPRREFNFFFCLNRLFPKSPYFSARELDYWDHLDSRYVECLSGACMLVRKEIIDELKGFDNELFMYAEDIDLCFRIIKAGWQNYYLSSENIIHYEGASSSKTKKRYFSDMLQHESNYLFLKKNMGAITALNYRIIVLFGSIFRVLLSTPVYLLYIMRQNDEKKKIYQIMTKYTYILLWSVGEKNISGLIKS